MTTHTAALEAKHVQALEHLAAAGRALHTMAVSLAPRLARWPIEIALASRELEALVEHPRCPRELTLAYGAWRRAVSAERKARRALHMARFEPAPVPQPAPRPRPKHNIGFADYVRQRWAEEREALEYA